MLRDRVRDYFIDRGHNCAESMLLASNDHYNLGLSPETMKLVSGFGGGMGCGRVCGALCGSISVLGLIVPRETLRDVCGVFAERFAARLGSDICDELVKDYKAPEFRCLSLMNITSDLLEGMLDEVKGS